MTISTRTRSALGAALAAAGLAAAQPAAATPIMIGAEQDATLSNLSPSATSDSSTYLFVGDNTGARDYQSLIGFDMTPLTGLPGPGQALVIDSLTLSAFHSYHPGGAATPVAAGVGLDDDWSPGTATYAEFGGRHGGVAATALTSADTLGGRVSWDLSGIDPAAFLADGYLTLYLFTEGAPLGHSSNNWNTFEPENSAGTNPPVLSVDYAIVSASVPVPPALPLLAAGLAALGALARRRRG